MQRTSPRFPVSAFIVLGAFAAAAVAVLLVAAALVSMRGEGTVADVAAPFVPQVAPTEEEYAAQAGAAVRPFFARAATATVADFDGDTASLRALVTSAQDELLKVRVPAEYRDTHLSIVLLLEQWKRALSGSVADRQPALDAAAALAASETWIAGPAAADDAD